MLWKCSAHLCLLSLHNPWHHVCACSVLLWHRSDNLAFAIVTGGAPLIQTGEAVECKIKGVLQVGGAGGRGRGLFGGGACWGGWGVVMGRPSSRLGRWWNGMQDPGRVQVGSGEGLVGCFREGSGEGEGVWGRGAPYPGW